jgi:hypothetical protein
MVWGPTSRRIDVACTLRVGQTPESLHAHMELDAIDINPGDIVRLIQAAPTSVSRDETVYQARVSVERAGFLARMLTRVSGFFSILELIEVGFEPKEVK